MVGEALTYRLLKFEKLVTRSATYPHDVTVRRNAIVLISDQTWTPPHYDSRFKNWYYGNDWYVVIVPGFGPFELALEGHIVRHGIEI